MTLPDYIISKISTPFEYGVNDCILFTIGWVEIATGKKYLPDVIWKDEAEALELINTNGGLVSVFDQRFVRIPANFAKDGDLTIVDGIAYLFSGSRIVSVGKDGLMFKSRTMAEIGWTHGSGR